MMKSKAVQRLLRFLVMLLGAGVGVALALGTVQLYGMVAPGQALPLWVVVALYVGLGLIFGAVGFLAGPWLVQHCVNGVATLEKRMDRLTFGQLVASTGGLVVGLIIASLLSQMLSFMGASMFTIAFSAILYVLLAVVGVTVGWKRSGDVTALMERMPGRIGRRSRKADAHTGDVRPKLLDTSVLIDGRIAEICRLGFAEGEMVVPTFVLTELRRLADAADPQKRARGRRGLEVLTRMQQELKLPLRTDDTDYDDLPDVDARLVRLAVDMDAAIITDDYNLSKVAAVTGVRVLNLNELANVLRPSVTAGDEMHVQILKEGKEPGQGVGYLPDGTMVVVDGARKLVGEAVTAVVTSALQTNAGRMVFARLKE